MKSILITAALLMIITPAALADGPAAVPPIGAVACVDVVCMVADEHDTWTRPSAVLVAFSEPYNIPGSVLLRPDGGWQWGAAGCSSVNLPIGPFVGGACTIVPGQHVGWQAERHHPYRKDPYFIASFWRYYPARNGAPVVPGRYADSLEYHPELNSPDCNPTGDNQALMVLYPGLDGVGYVASSSAPDEFREACRLLTSAEAAERVAELRVFHETQLFGPVGVARSCPSIIASGKRRMVRSSGVRCTPARNVLARYVRANRSTPGFRCSKGATWAKCSRASGRATVARWRP